MSCLVVPPAPGQLFRLFQKFVGLDFDDPSLLQYSEVSMIYTGGPPHSLALILSVRMKPLSCFPFLPRTVGLTFFGAHLCSVCVSSFKVVFN